MLDSLNVAGFSLYLKNGHTERMADDNTRGHISS